jgi:hypothetical protein
MSLSPKALAYACALLWGGALLSVGLVNLAIPSYGIDFLRIVSSVYPGFHAFGTLLDVLVGVGYGLVDGAIAGFLLAWLFNFFAKRA